AVDVERAAAGVVHGLGAFTYVGPLSDDAALHRGTRRDDDVVGDHGVGPDPRAIVDAGVRPDHNWPFEFVVVDLRPAPHIDVLPQAGARGPDAPYAAIEHVALGTGKLLQSA